MALGVALLFPLLIMPITHEPSLVHAASGLGAPPSSIGLHPGPGQVRVTWADPGYGDGYISHVRVDAQPGDGSCTAVPGSGTCTVTGLRNGVAYTFAVYAVGVRGFNFEPAIAGPAWPCCSQPESPSNLSVMPSQGSAALSWEPPPNAQAAGGEFLYIVTSVPPGAGCTTSERSCRVGELVDGVGYVFSVVAQNPFGESPAAVSRLVTPKGPPGSPTDIQVFLGNRGSATVSWLGPANTGGDPITRYVAVAQPGGASCVSVGPLSCTLTGLRNGQRYRVSVTAYNANGAGAESSASQIARPLAGPGRVRGIQIRVSRERALVQWKAPKSTGGMPITNYQVKSSPGGVSCVTKTTSCAMDNLRPGGRYVFTVQATNKRGKGLVTQSRPINVPNRGSSVPRPEGTQPESPKPEQQFS